jgi:hypothetical protein
MKTSSRFALIALGICTALGVQAGIIGVAGGSGAPSTTLGSYTMTPFGDDSRAVFTDVTSTETTPIGGVVGFSSSMSLRTIGSGWATWSHGYTGDVYFGGETLLSLTLTMPAGTGAFYFYAEPNRQSNFNVSATSSGQVVQQLTNGFGGANYFGFYGTGGDTISSITISFATGSLGGAVGEFGIARAFTSVPDAGQTFGLLGAALVLVIGLRRRLA